GRIAASRQWQTRSHETIAVGTREGGGMITRSGIEKIRVGSVAAWLSASLIIVLMFHISATQAETDCVAIGNLVPYCGLPFPEDIEARRGGGGVIASDMHIEMSPAGITGLPGTLKWFNPKTRAITVLYPSASPTPPHGRSDWGDASCPGEIGAALLPHGLH